MNLTQIAEKLDIIACCDFEGKNPWYDGDPVNDCLEMQRDIKEISHWAEKARITAKNAKAFAGSDEYEAETMIEELNFLCTLLDHIK